MAGGKTIYGPDKDDRRTAVAAALPMPPTDADAWTRAGRCRCAPQAPCLPQAPCAPQARCIFKTRRVPKALCISKTRRVPENRRALETRCVPPPRSVRASALGLWLALLVCLVPCGCTSTKYLAIRNVRDNGLAESLALLSRSGPAITERSTSALKRFDLLDEYQQRRGGAVETIRRAIDETNDPELIFALCEVSYVEGKRAEKLHDQATALNLFGTALTNSYDYLFSEDLAAERNPYDPQFRRVCMIYNESLEDMLRLLSAGNRLRPGSTYTIATPESQLTVRTALRGGWQPDEFDRFEFVSDYSIQTLHNRHMTYGLGVPLIAVRQPTSSANSIEKYYPEGLSYAVTALMRCGPNSGWATAYPGHVARPGQAAHSGQAAYPDQRLPAATDGLLPPPRSSSPSLNPPLNQPGHLPAELLASDPLAAQLLAAEPAPPRRLGGAAESILEFYDPLHANQVRLNSQWVPLETDLTTPLAFFLDSPEFRSRNRVTEGLINPAKTQSQRGLFMLEPYDPNRIPVVMVHGLWSSPLTWMDMFNDLRSYPEIRDRYQFWFYLYPSGEPFWTSASQLRADLAQMRDSIDPHRHDANLDQMVLVGHSMGGLVSRLQTIESGNDFWQLVSDQPPEALRGPLDARQRLVSHLFFQPNPSIRRVVTIGTPHHGSNFANDYTRWLASRVIKLPQVALATTQALALANPGFFRDNKLVAAANAIDSLAADSPIFPVMRQAKKAPGVKYHNIIGVSEGRGWLGRKSKPGDGVVDLASARVDDVVSELIVNAEHTTIHTTDRAILEVRRILLEHLAEVDQNGRLTTSR